MNGRFLIFRSENANKQSSTRAHNRNVLVGTVPEYWSECVNVAQAMTHCLQMKLTGNAEKNFAIEETFVYRHILLRHLFQQRVTVWLHRKNLR